MIHLALLPNPLPPLNEAGHPRLFAAGAVCKAAGEEFGLGAEIVGDGCGRGVLGDVEVVVEGGVVRGGVPGEGPGHAGFVGG